MEITMRQRILNFLEKSESPFTAEEMAKELGYNRRKIQEACTALKRQKRITYVNKEHPWRYCFESNGIASSLPKKAQLKKEKKINEPFDLNNYMILYVTEGSVFKLLQEFNGPEELITKFEELQKLPDLVSIAAYKKLEIVQKVEIKF